MTDIGPQLRRLIIAARKDPKRWGKPRGLSQVELAKKAGTSQVWLRQIETGYAPSASAGTLGTICYVLEINPVIVRTMGYEDVADAIDACIMLRENAIPDHLIDRPERRKTAEEHIRKTPGITEEQKRLLVDALHAIRRQEPLGRELWRRRGDKRRRG